MILTALKLTQSLLYIKRSKCDAAPSLPPDVVKCFLKAYQALLFSPFDVTMILTALKLTQSLLYIKRSKCDAAPSLPPDVVKCFLKAYQASLFSPFDITMKLTALKLTQCLLYVKRSKCDGAPSLPPDVVKFFLKDYQAFLFFTICCQTDTMVCLHKKIKKSDATLSNSRSALSQFETCHVKSDCSICKQQRCGSACTSAQSHQHLQIFVDCFLDSTVLLQILN